MQSTESNSHFRDLTRGGQTFMHALRMFIQVFRYAFFSAVVLFFCLFFVFSAIKTTEINRYFFYEYLEAKFKVSLNDQAYSIIKNPKGRHPAFIEIPSHHFIKEPLTLYHVDQCLKGIFGALKWSLTLSITALFSFLVYLKQKGRRAKASEKVIGTGRVSPRELSVLLKAKGKASSLTLAGLPLLKGLEVQHILLAGTTGTGKSVCIQELMDQVRANAQKAVVFDIDGSLVANYYRPGKDIILNPLDARCPPWNIWQECRDKADYESLAHSLMPLHLSSHDPFWINAAHTIFSSAAALLNAMNEKQNTKLFEFLFSEKMIAEQMQSNSKTVLFGNTLNELLLARNLLSEKNEKTALSIKATLAAYCKSLLYLRDDTLGPLFSIRRWIEADTQDSWLFIATDAQKIEAIKPLLSVWLDVAAKSVLSLPPFSERRLWFFADELPKLHRLPSLLSLLERGRKYGACFVGSIQDVHQIHSVYGRNDAETLTSLFNTKIFFRSQEPESIAWMSKVMGGLEFIEKKEGFSYGANDMRDGVSIHQERRREPVVKEAEFSELQDLQAFLKLPGSWPVTKIEFEIQKRIFTQPYFVPRPSAESEMQDKAVLEVTNTVKNTVQEEPNDLQENSKPPSAREEPSWELL
jgi:type IV conjugative transfer system coupling protein TraD